MEEKNPNYAYIKEVTINGYRSIQKASTTFENGLNIIIGKNASGKTSFLECLSAGIRGQREITFSMIELLFEDLTKRQIIVRKERAQKSKEEKSETGLL